ncbi:MAG: sulfite exporter TauE/SafE family protein [Burkholderiaceae bacterium]|nr:sulfite exporter TauE/SafE family protein [Burkholderiaceae bacterium]
MSSFLDFFPKLMPIPFDLANWAIAATIVGFSYIIFGITAFGAAMFTVPLLSLLFPLDFVLPLCVLLDVAAALALGSRFSKDADKSELKWMVPFAAIGAVVGVTLLVNLPSTATIGAFGLFLTAYALHILLSKSIRGTVSKGWAPIAGVTGGITGTLFGVGAPPYAIYLSRRLQEKNRLRATLSNMVLFSTSIRAIVFLVSGLMLLDRLIAFLFLVPFGLMGLWVGNRIHSRLSQEAVQRIAAFLILAIGSSLLYRALAG